MPEHLVPCGLEDGDSIKDDTLKRGVPRVLRLRDSPGRADRGERARPRAPL
jgi:hypothetical protein